MRCFWPPPIFVRGCVVWRTWFLVFGFDPQRNLRKCRQLMELLPIVCEASPSFHFT